MKTLIKTMAGVAILAMASAANAAVIDFTGGVVSGGGTHYEENGFQIDVIGGAASFGDYYGVGNNVIHAHWDAGDFGSITQIKVSQIGGGTFDLNYFILTSNTRTGGGFASGTEQAWIKNNLGNDILLPSQDWGFGTGGPFPGTSQIYLPSSYDAITEFSFYVTSDVDCFGMDEFYINEPAPPSVPDGGSAFFLLTLGMSALAGLKMRMRA